MHIDIDIGYTGEEKDWRTFFRAEFGAVLRSISYVWNFQAENAMEQNTADILVAISLHEIDYLTSCYTASL